MLNRKVQQKVLWFLLPPSKNPPVQVFMCCSPQQLFLRESCFVLPAVAAESQMKTPGPILSGFASPGELCCTSSLCNLAQVGKWVLKLDIDPTGTSQTTLQCQDSVLKQYGLLEHSSGTTTLGVYIIGPFQRRPESDSDATWAFHKPVTT